MDIVERIIPTDDSFPVTYGDTIDSEHVFVRVQTTDDRVGYGEGTALPWFTGESAPDMKAVIERWIAPQIRGETVTTAAVNVADFAADFPGNPGAKAAVEMALLDLRAKSLEVPLAELFGLPRRESIPVAFTIPGIDPDAAARLATRQHGAGFTHFKLKATGEFAQDVERIDRVVEAIPPETTLSVDANGGWVNAPTAIRVVETVERPERITSLEQPVTSDRVEDLRTVWEETRTPVYADESAHSVADVDLLGRKHLVAGCHLKLAKTGSLREAVRLIETAHRHDLAVTITSALGTSLDAAANLHLAAIAPNLSEACEIGANYLREDPALPQLGREPTMAVPDRPGLGVELDDELFD